MLSLMVIWVLAVLLFIVRLIGIKIHLISGYQRAFMAMAEIIALKWPIVHLYNLFRQINHDYYYKDMFKSPY
jgi:hypothetical protein